LTDMKYDLFLFDADDTLFDFKSCERHAFAETLKAHRVEIEFDSIFETYRLESAILWSELEQGKISKDFLKSERFRRTFAKHDVQLSADEVGETYLDLLPQTCVLVDHALEICQYLSEKGQIGIVTNGFEVVQTRRLAASVLTPYIKFMVVSEQCGFTKPDVRFFDFTARKIQNFRKETTLVIGDRLETDVAGAHGFGLDACWYNPTKLKTSTVTPKYEISHLSELKMIVPN
jgi:2-haloacid dehalogenase